MKWFENIEIYDEKRLKEETDYHPFDWCNVNNIWINFNSDEYELMNGIYILKRDE